MNKKWLIANIVLFLAFIILFSYLIKVEVNESVVMPAILLTEKAKGFKLDLKNGFNVVDFVALNQGSSGPNTAEIIVYDDQGKLVGTNRWNLATGVKATYIIYKN